MAPACAASSAAALAPAPPHRPRGCVPGRIARASRAGSRPAPTRSRPRHAGSTAEERVLARRGIGRRLHPLEQELEGRGRAPRLLSAGPRPDVPPDRHAPRRRPPRRSGRRAWPALPPSGPAMPVTETARSAPRRPAAGRHRHRHLCRTAPWAASTSCGTPTTSRLSRRNRSRTRRGSRRSSPGPG